DSDTYGVPDANYQARLGHSVVIGDSANGTQNAQTLLGADTTSDKPNSVALGFASNASRGPQLTGYSAYGLTDTQYSDGEVSVGGSNTTAAGDDVDFTRQITHVAAGSDAYDAVNVMQLKGAVSGALSSSELHYYSVNDGGTHGGNYSNDGATQAGALAAGIDAKADGKDSIAVGHGASASDNGGIAIG